MWAFFIFFEGLGNFLKTIFLFVGFASSLTKLCHAVGLRGFGNVLAKWIG
jgi:hypothetical protein